MKNQIYYIEPFKKGDLWVFNDETTGLVEEPFISGIPEIINYYVGKKVSKIGLLFSKAMFPEYTTKLQKKKSEFGGAWYTDYNNGLEGWLCPALFRYFEKAPNRLFVKIT